MKDIRTIETFIKESTDIGKSKEEGIKAAAKHFGVTLNALRIRYGRYTKGKQVANLKKNTTKVPMKRKKRKYTKRAGVKPGPKPKEPTGRSMTFKITNVQVDLNKGEITVSY